MPHLAIIRVHVSNLLSVWKLLVVVEEKLASCRRDNRWMRFDSEAPECVSELVDTVVSHITSAEVVPPIPTVMKSIGLEWHPFRWSNPRIVIDVGGHRGW